MPDVRKDGQAVRVALAGKPQSARALRPLPLGNAALGTGPGPVLPPPWAQEVQQPSDWSQQPQFVRAAATDPKERKG